ncbi:DUF4351 domain-containing protein [Massilia sp. SR12]
MPSPSPAARYDSPWKLVLTHAFRAFMDFYFPDLSAQIDWSRRPRFLDKELAQTGFGDAPAGRVADKLVALYLRDGTEHWILVHIEIQAQRDDTFARRVHALNNRIFEQHDRPVASLALLADEDPHWHPVGFHNKLLGTTMGITFASVKLLDYADRIDQLQASRNPFALVTLAHLYTQRTKHDAASRYAAKWRLTKLLFQRGWSRKRIIILFKAINWMMTLPAELENRYWQAVRKLEQERKMEELRLEYVSTLEQMWLRQGATMVLQQQLTERFGPLSLTNQRKLANATLDQIAAWSKAVLNAQSLKQVFSATELAKTH